MDCFFLKVKIAEFTFNANQETTNNISELNEIQEKVNEENNSNYEINFELTKSNELYVLQIINDNNNNKIPFSNYFTIPTLINIDKNNNISNNEDNFIDKDSLEISLYSNNSEKKLIDIDNDILIDINCINQPKFAELSLGNFHIKLLFKLSCFEDLCIRENDMIFMTNNISENNFKEDNYNNLDENNSMNMQLIDENNNNEYKENNDEEEEEDLVTKYHNILSSKPEEDDILYDESLFQEIAPINLNYDLGNDSPKKNKENNNSNLLNTNESINEEGSPCGIYHNIKSIDFFDINVDIFEEEEKEDEEDKIDNYYNNNDKNDDISNISENKNNNVGPKIYKNNHIIVYENVPLEKPKLKEIMKNNLIECFLISGLSQNKRPLSNSESYFSQCKHRNCQYNKSYSSDILFRLQKPNSNFAEIESSSISSLIFPYGIKICFGDNYLNPIFKKRSSTLFQETEYSFNILTDIKGKRYYIYSLTFFIQFEYEEFIKYFKEYKDINIKSTTLISKQINKSKIFVPFAFSLISKINNIDNFNLILNDLFTTFYSSKMDSDIFDNELIHLIFELPLPPINSIVKIYLPYSISEIKSNIYENKIFNNLNYYHILFQKNCYTICFIIKIFTLILLEKKILIHSSKQNKIYETIEAILNLIYPLKWVNVYIPLIPDENINIVLQSFLPFIIGMTHQSFFNYANKIEQLNSGSNNQEENYENIFIVNLDTENILPTKKMNELIDKSPMYEKIEAEYHKIKQSKGKMTNDKLKNIFLENMVDIFGDYEKFTSKLGENNLFNQKIYLRNKDKKYLYFYQEITSTQQFYQFINEINNSDIYYKEFKDIIKNINNFKNCKSKSLLLDFANKNADEEIYLDKYNLYPYFFKQENKDDIDLFSFEDEIDLYYNCLNKEHKINYLLDTEAYIRIKLILQNYIPQNLKKYIIEERKIQNEKENQNKDKINNNYISNYFSNYDSNLSADGFKNGKLKNIKNIFGNIYENMKKSIIKNIFSETNDENKENIDNNIQIKKSITKRKTDILENKVPYRKRDSLINMIRNNCDKNELLLYKEQIIDLLKDYMGYILSNEREDIPFSLKELSKLLSYRRIRREFSKILYQNKFDNNTEHELSEETFGLLYQTVFLCLVNMSDNKNEYKILRRVIKSMFYYYYKDIKEQKVYLYQKIMEKNDKFYFTRSSNFWKYYYKIENYEFPEDDNLSKTKNIMNMINVDNSISNNLE